MSRVAGRGGSAPFKGRNYAGAGGRARECRARHPDAGELHYTVTSSFASDNEHVAAVVRVFLQLSEQQQETNRLRAQLAELQDELDRERVS